MSDGSTVITERTTRPIELTPEAIKHGKRTLAEAGEAGVLGLRVGVKGGGCAGYSYVFDLATKVRPGRDVVYDFDGLAVIVDDRSVELLRGATLDWEQRLMGYGFKWKNPNAKDDCGCGVSFST
jgi:iron-sulfur cluster assembly accessory protein